MDSSDLFSNVKPSWRLLKEYINSNFSEEEINRLVKNKGIVTDLEQFFLRDAMAFLRLSILNLMAYKYLMCGHYLAWGKVTLHFSFFYSMNSFLRLKGFALIHITKIPPFCVEKIDKDCFKFKKSKKSSHRTLWNKFFEYKHEKGEIRFPITDAMLSERYMWNYDLLFPSQSMNEGAIKDADTYCQNNFLDPNYGKFEDPDASEYHWDLMNAIGYEEKLAGDLIKECITMLGKKAQKSKYKTDYVAYFQGMLEGIKSFKTKQDMKKEIEKWIQETLNDL